MIIILVFSLAFLLIWGGFAINENTSIGGTFLYYIVLAVFISLAIYYKIDTPSAIDVYRGKTVLKITYEGDTPVDSCVIYKKYVERDNR